MGSEIPITYQDISNRLTGSNSANLFDLRKQTILKIEDITGIPLICYVSKTSGVPRGTQISIDENDIIGFSDLINTTPGDSIDIFLISNGGSPEAAYMPLISKYDLHLLSICRSAQELSKELAGQYLKQYMKKDDTKIKEITEFFMNHEMHKSHGRSIDRNIALAQGLNIIKSEEIKDRDGKVSELDSYLLSLAVL
jgi:hypothetical protein